MDILGVVLFVSAGMREVLDGLVAVGFWFRREGVCMFVSFVQPVMILSAVFWVVLSLFRLVWDVTGDQMVLAYSRIGSVIAL